MNKKTLLITMLLVVAIGLAAVVPAAASEGDGCTPGYWKQRHHFDSWPEGYSPNMTLGAAFDGLELGHWSDFTMREALRFRGGKWNAFWRHATAALLNAAHADVAYPNECWVKYGAQDCSDGNGGVDDVLAGETRVGSQKYFFEKYNSRGCPLN